jgi:serine/threonine protein kinase
LVVRDRQTFWPLIEAILPGISRMHRCGVTHLDLNLGNILVDPRTSKIAFIDFEFGCRATVTIPQQQAYDYLRLIDECLRPRRGGKQLLNEMDRLVGGLRGCVDGAVREADLSGFLEKLRRLAAHAELCQKLRTVFPHLEPSGFPREHDAVCDAMFDPCSGPAIRAVESPE